jgi:hypothetical protein
MPSAAGTSANQAIEVDENENLDDQAREAEENQRINEVHISTSRSSGHPDMLQVSG